MKIGALNFEVKDNKVFLVKQGDIDCVPKGFTDVQIAGKRKPTALGIKTAQTSECIELEFVGWEKQDNTLIITQKSSSVMIKTYLTEYENTSAVSVYNEITNITSEDIVLEEVSALTIKNLLGANLNDNEKLYFTKFYQSHHGECQPKRRSFKEWSLTCCKAESANRILCANVGSQSSKLELPFGIIDDGENYLAFQVESNHSWLYDVCDTEGQFCLWLGSANLNFLNWAKKLKPKETYKTISVSICISKSLNGAMADITTYRRLISKNSPADKDLPVIFNEYMWLCWDSPSEENTKKIAPIAKQAGADYYVIDCGWHDEVDGNIIYPYVGGWVQSNARFPNGVKKTTDYIRSLGMKAGLWIEPEVVGIECQEMLKVYDDDCFIQRFNKKVISSTRYLLDYRNEKVRKTMTQTIRRMVEEYGAEYIKFDYNQDLGVGTDLNSFTFGEGLEQASNAYLTWVEEISKLFPNVIFENCSSGGNRLDYQTMSRFDLASTSDCMAYNRYPYISANVVSAVIPEHAGVWCYPVADIKSDKEITCERIVMNVINSLLGRMHLASDLSVLNNAQFELVKEGIALYKSLVEFKKQASPYLPLGFIEYGASVVSAGLKWDDEIILAVWCLNGETKANIPLERDIESVSVLYPSTSTAKVKAKKNNISVKFERKEGSILLKIKLK